MNALIPRLKPLLFVVCLLPLFLLVWQANAGGLGANPIETITRTLGDWALRFLLITLTITPLRRLSGWGSLMRLRRMLGLYTFFYAALHLSSYIGLDQFFSWGEIAKDLLKRPFMSIGMVTFALLLPLAITSSNGWQRRLGGRRWRRLHRLVYPAAIGAVLHFIMMVKADLREPLLYAAILALLLSYRLLHSTAWLSVGVKANDREQQPANHSPSARRQ